MKVIDVPDHLEALATQNLSIVLLSRPQHSGRPFAGLHLGDDIYAVVRFVTSIKLYDEQLPDEEIEGVAVCSPEDKFDSELGVRIALGRALKEYEEVRVDQQLVLWDNLYSILHDEYIDGLYG
jgi:hypothetical protein